MSVWLSCAYAAFLLAVAFGVDALAKRAAARTLAWRSGGFTYHADHDAWRCPQDQLLWPHSFDPDHRVMRYRGRPLVCNACPVKSSCTTSDRGREISRNVDPWPSSEAERFHRGIACAIAVLAIGWPLATALTAQTALQASLLVCASAAVLLGSWPLWSHLRRSPASFPEHVKVETLEEAAGAAEGDRRTAYRSDGRRSRAQAQEFAERWSTFARGGEAHPPPGGWSRMSRR